MNRIGALLEIILSSVAAFAQRGEAPTGFSLEGFWSGIYHENELERTATLGCRQGRGSREAMPGYGAPAIMRQPGRMHITWDNDNTLKFEMDTGKQTRLFTFGAARQSTGEPTLQGSSMARWRTYN